MEFCITWVHKPVGIKIIDCFLDPINPWQLIRIICNDDYCLYQIGFPQPKIIDLRPWWFTLDFSFLETFVAYVGEEEEVDAVSESLFLSSMFSCSIISVSSISSS